MGKTISRMWTPNVVYMVRGSYNFEKVLNFTSGLEKSLKSTSFLYYSSEVLKEEKPQDFKSAVVKENRPVFEQV